MPPSGETSNGRRRWTQPLGAVLAVTPAVMGVAELVVRLDEPAPLLFWLPTLWGGSLLLAVGTFLVRSSTLRLATIAAGVFLGALPTFWTLIVPAAGVLLVVLVAGEASSTRPTPDTPLT